MYRVEPRWCISDLLCDKCEVSTKVLGQPTRFKRITNGNVLGGGGREKKVHHSTLTTIMR